MILDIKPYNRAGYDCMNLSVTNILFYKNYPHSNSVWKQSGLIYYIDEKYGIGNLEGSYLTRVQELEWIHNIKVKTIKHKYKNDFLSGIINLLRENEPVLVPVDTYYTRGNMYYQTRHTPHIITIIGYEESLFTYVDDAYGSIAELKPKELIEANSMNLKYMYIKLPEENYLTKEILLEPIKHNNNNLRGIISTSNIPDVPGVIKEFGLSGLEKFLDFYYEHNIDDTFNQSEEKIMEIYRGLSAVSNSRYKYADYLFDISVYYPEIKNIAEAYLFIGQDWKVSANMVLKSTMNNRLNLIQRMLDKVELIMEKEKETLRMSEEIHSIICNK
ncbi:MULTISPECIES: hypothetical protein [Bacillus]|nr:MULTISPECIES: hypothetical protein [Bacillus]MBU8842188.1 BtrH N-terminal domain-containing protein [Alkalicoccobacillus gibsonii]TWG54343.1 hypothetical protein L608_000300003140 [Bacillus subtilis J23]TWG70117.1 hypothetical protein L606_000200006840 [Bacillus subtilis J25]HCJ7961483.1 hypothetical protein [Klebsiella pneumoniae]ADV93487.1 hypothetical protein BSn5_04295 [Bacillus subtilis BSn5]